MTPSPTPSDRLEQAGFTVRSSGCTQSEVYAPNGAHVATLDWDGITLRPTVFMAHEIATLLIRYYAPTRLG